MNSRFLLLLSTIALFTALALPVQLVAQERRPNHHQPHYKLVDLGTLGGPQSAGFGIMLNNRGTVSGCADTSTPDPNYPNFNPFLSPFGADPFIFHTFSSQGGALTDLRALPGVNSSCVSFITDEGLIAGASENGLIDPLTGLPEVEGVAWSGGKIIDLKTFGGNGSFAIWANNHGQVVGAAANTIPDPYSVFFGWGTQSRAFVWSESEGLRDLGTLGGPDALATMINDRGQIFGASYTSDIPNPITQIPPYDAFFYEKGKMRDIPNAFGGTQTNPFFANNRGQLVGDASLPGEQFFHPFLWGKGVFTDLGTFGGDNGEADWINDHGEVAGSADFPGDQIHHGAFWARNGAMTDVGTVDGDPCSRAFSLNKKDQVVGSSTDCSTYLHAFLWQNGQITDLNTFVPPGSGLQLTVALDINDGGEISGNATLANGDQHAFLLIPCEGDDDGCRGVSPTGATPAHAALGDRPGGTLDRPRPRWGQRHQLSGSATGRAN